MSKIDLSDYVTLIFMFIPLLLVSIFVKKVLLSLLLCMFHYIDCPLFMSPPEQCSGGDIDLGHLPATLPLSISISKVCP